MLREYSLFLIAALAILEGSHSLSDLAFGKAPRDEGRRAKGSVSQRTTKGRKFGSGDRAVTRKGSLAQTCRDIRA